MAEDKVVVRLREPIQFGSDTIAELVIQKPKAKHFRRMSAKPSMGDMLDLLGTLSGQPKAVIDELSFVDMNAATEALSVFMPAGQETGSELLQ